MRLIISRDRHSAHAESACRSRNNLRIVTSIALMTNALSTTHLQEGSDLAPQSVRIHRASQRRRELGSIQTLSITASILFSKVNALCFAFAIAIAIAALLFPDSMLGIRNFVQSFSSSSAARTMTKLKTPPAPTLPTAIKSREEAKLEEGSKSFCVPLRFRLLKSASP